VGNGATSEEIRAAERDLGVSLPPDYAAFLAKTNGGELGLGGNQLFLWPVENLTRENEGYEVERSAPGLVLFGHAGGLEAYGFDARNARMEVVMVPWVPMDWASAIPCGRTFTEFLDIQRRGGCFRYADPD
jgi:hypothetical protein